MGTRDDGSICDVIKLPTLEPLVLLVASLFAKGDMEKQKQANPLSI